MPETLLTTPLEQWHRHHGARMVPFAGYSMPVQYDFKGDLAARCKGGVMAEHLYCREQAALFDVSHMGQAMLHGPGATAALERLVCGDIAGLRPSRQRYTLLTTATGGILDDLMVANLGPEGLFLVVNASRKAVDFDHIGTVTPVTPLADRALLALQGPAAAAVMARIAPGAAALPFMGIARIPVAGIPCLVSRSGYTGEDGFEISVSRGVAVTLANRLVDQPEVVPAGLGARDSLRLEAGLCLYGNDIDETTSPPEAALSWAIGKRRKMDWNFLGGPVIRAQLDNGPSRLRVGIRPDGRAPAREHTEIQTPDGRSGWPEITSGGFGPTVNGPIAMGYVRRDFAADGSKLSLLVRGETFARDRRSAAIRAAPLSPLNRSTPMPGKNADTRYTKEHEWVRLDGDIVTVGITDYAQQQLGELVFIELPELEREVAAGEACAVVESVKAASEIYAPLAGRVAEINETIVEDPEIVNNDAESEGWFFRLEIDDPAVFEELMDQDAYDEFLDVVSMDLLSELEAADQFVSRHIGPSDADIAAMLHTIGRASLDDAASAAVPESIRSNQAMNLPPPVDEAAVIAELRDLASRNVLKKSLIGMGYHGTVTPPVILRNVLENPGWYTAYTPYQAEIAQGRLEALVNFQTLICELTGMEIANASMLDEATAAAEAMAMAHAISKTKSDMIAVADDVHPQTRAVLTTRAHALGLSLGRLGEGSPFAVLLQYPGTTGEVRDLTADITAAKAGGALVIVAADPLALVLLKPPGEMGADIVVGSSQRFGVPMGFGGPHAAFFATRDAFRRHMPGRLVGVSIDAAGEPAMRLALQTREQHIRREKATSNICTAQVLLAVIAGMYAVWHGPAGLRRIARRVNLQARMLADCAIRGGHRIRYASFFDTIVVECADQAAMLGAARDGGFNFRPVDDGAVAIALDETVTRDDLTALALLLGAPLAGAATGCVAVRAGSLLPQTVFNRYHSEHDMLRYLKRLEDKDIALNRSMIPLGSCTMKLNAAAEMIPITWPGFADMHPFAPEDQTEGFRILIQRLAEWLRELTGFAAVSLQPNAGSQGEYAGLLAIRRWHASRGAAHRDICLIPASAHGTNPASAAMAGLQVVVVGCDRDGNVDLGGLREKVGRYRDRLAALMVTYPSTHGVFEAEIRDICAIVHDAGGQVYMDGANMNAQLGLTSPGLIGADVCHLNLHKTFCIPHGGGGPGVGPIGVAAHLVPFLPGNPMDVDAGAVSAAPFGSALILPISYAYIRMMGAAGLKRATEVAILNANYIAARLNGAFPILYRGGNGMVAHECIVDCRGFQTEAGIMVEDIAKRLQDYGYHAPTMSWPVAGTLMIEPTESESKAELDRFCDAMIAIRGEIAEIAWGRMDKVDNPLKHAPHTAREVTADIWNHPYSRQQAAFPLPFVAASKYWPPVKRVDNVYGDRNLVCTCAPLEAYAEAAE